MRFSCAVVFAAFAACQEPSIANQPAAPPSTVATKTGNVQCSGLWTPRTAQPCATEGDTCDDGNPCTYNDACRNNTCIGVPDTYCTPCRTDSDCCGRGHFAHCYRPTNRAAVAPQDERTACIANKCLLVTIEYHPSCAKLVSQSQD